MIKKGSKVKISPDTICLHGDNLTSVKLAEKIKKELFLSGCEVKPMKDFIKTNV